MLKPKKLTAIVQAQEINKFENFTKEIIKGEVTMYSSEVGQTDDTPFITANGDTVGQGTIACPSKLKFGTNVEIDGVMYKCNDRMHSRYRQQNYFDIWTPETKTAWDWGRQTKNITIYHEILIQEKTK